MSYERYTDWLEKDARVAVEHAESVLEFARKEIERDC